MKNNIYWGILLVAFAFISCTEEARKEIPKQSSDSREEVAKKNKSSLLIRAINFQENKVLNELLDSFKHIQKNKKIEILSYEPDPKSGSFKMAIQSQLNGEDLEKLVRDNLEAFGCPIEIKSKQDILNIFPIHKQPGLAESKGHDIEISRPSSETSPLPSAENTKEKSEVKKEEERIQIQLVEFEDSVLLEEIKNDIARLFQESGKVAKIRKPTMKSYQMETNISQEQKEGLLEKIRNHFSEKSIRIRCSGFTITLSPN
ncbi:MAG: hypothetical protein HUU50_06545 [Candidatus Brocadiae bacterium]|nr:hypothetical protein [Candidatus Brocadiia bacterium]